MVKDKVSDNTPNISRKTQFIGLALIALIAFGSSSVASFEGMRLNNADIRDDASNVIYDASNDYIPDSILQYDYLQTSGGALSGTLNMNGNTIYDIGNNGLSLGQDAGTGEYIQAFSWAAGSSDSPGDDVIVGAEDDIILGSGGTNNNCIIDESGNINCAGNKNAKIYLPKYDDTVYMHAVESAETKFTFSGNLTISSKKGGTKITFPERFQEVISNKEKPNVQLTTTDACNAYVESKTWKSFTAKQFDNTIKDKNGGCGVDFVVRATRRGYYDSHQFTSGQFNRREFCSRLEGEGTVHDACMNPNQSYNYTTENISKIYNEDLVEKYGKDYFKKNK